MDLERGRLPMERSSSARSGTEMSSFALADPGMQLQPSEPVESEKAENEGSPALDSTRWPGSDFKLADVLPDSVYLWACGEPFPGVNTRYVSRSQTAAAWVIIISQAICYAGLWFVAGNRPVGRPSSENEVLADYSIVAIAGAMYLILSIAAADVWCGCALLLEGRGPDFILFTRRRVFGVVLLSTFAMLIGASIRVLFYSATENLQLVLGSAAVLFIADVDEKAMAVLKNISGEWILFWVLEFVGLSFGLAVFAVKVTGNAEAVDELKEAESCNPSEKGGDCDVLTWDFVINEQPTAVTAFAFLLTGVIARTTTSLPGRIIFPRSWQWLVITLFTLGWAAQGPLWLVHPATSRWVESCFGGFSLVFILTWYRRQLTQTNWVQMWRNVAPHGGRRILYIGAFVISLRFTVEVLWLVVSDKDSYDLHAYFNHGFDALDFLFAALYLIIFVWLMNGLRMANLRSADRDSTLALLPFLQPMLLGWGLSEAYFGLLHWVFYPAWTIHDMYPNSYPGIILAENLFSLVCYLIVGAVLWNESGGVRGVAYWTATNLVRVPVVDCAWIWVSAVLDTAGK